MSNFNPENDLVILATVNKEKIPQASRLIRGRIAALEALEAAVNANGISFPLRGNITFRRFAEGQDVGVSWAGCRIDVVTIPAAVEAK